MSDTTDVDSRFEAFMRETNLSYSDLSTSDLKGLLDSYELNDLAWLEETIRKIEKKTEFSDTLHLWFFDPDDLQAKIDEKLREEREQNERIQRFTLALEEQVMSLLRKYNFSFKPRKSFGIDLHDYLDTPFGTIRISDHAQVPGGGFNNGTGKRSGESEISIYHDGDGHVIVQRWKPDIDELTDDEIKRLEDLSEEIHEATLPMTAVKAYAGDPMSVAPDSEGGGYSRMDQLADVAIPNSSPIDVREALMVKPYYLGEEQRFLPDAVKYPNVRKILEEGIRLKPEYSKVSLDTGKIGNMPMPQVDAVMYPAITKEVEMTKEAPKGEENLEENDGTANHESNPG